MDVQLRVLEGTLRRGTGEDVDRFKIADRHFIIGSDSSCRMVCENPTVSGHHCAINVTPAGVYIHDLASETGTFINDRRIEGTTSVRDGDRLRIGGMEFEFLIQRESPRATKPAAAGDTPSSSPSGPDPLLPPPPPEPEIEEAPSARDTTIIPPSAVDTASELNPVQLPPPSPDPDTVDLIVNMLEEADDAERQRRIADPAERYLHVEPVPESEEEVVVDKVQEALRQAKEAASRPPKKLPPRPGVTGKDSMDAADKALDRIFETRKQAGS